MSLLDDTRKALGKVLGWDDDRLLAVDFVASCFIATYLKGDVQRPWGVLVGAGSSGKTTILDAFGFRNRKHPRTVNMGGLTENALVSGFRSDKDPDFDPSLVARLQHYRDPVGPKVMLLPEMSTLLTMKKTHLDKVLGYLRTIFDGKVDLTSGSVGKVEYPQVGAGFIGASTEVIDDFMATNQILGERVILFRLGNQLSDYDFRRVHARAALRVDREAKLKAQEAAALSAEALIDETLKTIRESSKGIGRPERLLNLTSDLGSLLSLLRSCPLGSGRLVRSGEAPNRFLGQLAALQDGHALADDRPEWTDQDYALSLQVSKDSLPPDCSRLWASLWNLGSEGGEFTSGDVLSHADVHPRIGINQLRQWSRIGGLKGIARDRYCIPSNIQEDIRSTGLILGETNDK